MVRLSKQFLQQNAEKIQRLREESLRVNPERKLNKLGEWMLAHKDDPPIFVFGNSARKKLGLE